MKTKLMILVLALMGANSAFGGDTNNSPAVTNAATAQTNANLKLHGLLSKTRVITADQATIDKITIVQGKLRNLRKKEAAAAGPQTLQEAADLLGSRIAMACPPGACFEYDGWFYFSGGLSTALETNFLSGFAVKKGDTAIYSWKKDSPNKKDQTVPDPKQKPGK